MALKNNRLTSIDALRGFDMMFIAGLAGLISAICCLFPGGSDCWLAQQMTHCSWEGLRHHDTIFPLFLFISGMTFPFSYAHHKEAGQSQSRIFWHVIRRGLTLVLLGAIYNGLFNLDFANLRWASVLGRIGLAWMFAAILYMFVRRSWRIVICIAILVGYWLLLWLVPDPTAPAGTDPFSLEGNLCGYIDRLFLPGRPLTGTFDPEGIVSTIPAIATAMLGMFTGEFVRIPEEKVSGGKKTLWILCAAVVLLAIGLLWSLVFPINKALWTSTFVLVVAAYSLAAFALFYWIIDVKGWKKWSFIFTVVGMNSITIYLAQRIFDFGQISDFFLGGLAGLLSPAWATVLLAFGYFLVSWLFLYFLYKKGVFLKV